jgi:predicted metal-dependent hydrolase
MLRINGIVKVANQVRQQLQVEIPPADLERLKDFVARSIQQIEQICAKNQTHPSQLSTPSRKAYEFLKRIDWERAIVGNSESTVCSIPSLRLQNVLKQQTEINLRLFVIAKQNKEIPLALSLLLKNYVGQIEEICSKNQVTPAALAKPSQMAYAWLKFLTNEDNLNLHLDAVKRSIAIGTHIIQTQKQGVGELFIEIFHHSLLYRYSTDSRAGRLGQRHITTIRMSEGFIKSSDEILETLIKSALLGKTKKALETIRAFAETEEYSDVILELDMVAELDGESAQGRFYDLDALFEIVNQQYFQGTLAKPRLVWSGIFSSRKFGHYERVRDRIVLSQTLDSDRVPQYTVEFVLYHELLHKHHGTQWVNGKCLVHTPEFRRSEKKFAQYLEAEDSLKRLAMET